MYLILLINQVLLFFLPFNGSQFEFLGKKTYLNYNLQDLIYRAILKEEKKYEKRGEAGAGAEIK